jgi:hypothetical protein
MLESKLIKYVLIFVIGIVFTYLAKRKNQKIEESLENLSADEIIKFKKDWMYDFWISKSKVALIAFGMIIGGAFGWFYFLINSNPFNPQGFVEKYGELLSYFCMALFALGFVYFLLKFAFPQSRYKAYMEDLDYEGISEEELKTEFSQKKINGR